MLRFIRYSLLLCIVFFFPSCGGEFEILLDSADSPATLYWAETGKTINSIRIDGTRRKTLLNRPGLPLGLAVYAPGGNIYWTEFTGSSYQIRRAGTDGGYDEMVKDFPLSGFFVGPTTLAIDASAGMLYMNRYHQVSGQNNILRSALVPFSEANWGNQTTLPYINDISLDTIHRKLYLTSGNYWQADGLYTGGGNAGDACIGDLDAAGPYTQVLTGTGQMPNSMPFQGIAVDGIGMGCFYVIDTGVNAIMKADLNLQNPVVWIVSNGFSIEKLALDVLGRKIYWTSENSNCIYRADMDTVSSAIDLFMELDSTPTGITISQ